MAEVQEPKINYEYERKFLLLRLPALKADVVAHIEQHYLDTNERIRRKSVEGEADVFYHTIKKNLRPGVNSEDEKKITREEYYSLLEKSKSFIVKKRYYYFIGEVRWEIDVFENMNLIVAEVEYPREDYVVNIPKFINNVILLEVTHLREFSNKNISKKKLNY